MITLALSFGEKALLSGVFIVVVMTAGMAMAIKSWWRIVRQGTALVRNGIGGTEVSFTGMLVFPVMHRAEIMDISMQRVEICRLGAEGLNCKDNLRADINVGFFVRVNNTQEDVKAVAQFMGCDRASDPDALLALFTAKFTEALKTVAKRFDFVELHDDREKFKQEVLAVIGNDLNGYALVDAAIDHLKLTRLEELDPNNILDAEGIKKMKELMAEEAVRANAIVREKAMEDSRRDVAE